MNKKLSIFLSSSIPSVPKKTSNSSPVSNFNSSKLGETKFTSRDGFGSCYTPAFRNYGWYSLGISPPASKGKCRDRPHPPRAHMPEVWIKPHCLPAQSGPSRCRAAQAIPRLLRIFLNRLQSPRTVDRCGL